MFFIMAAVLDSKLLRASSAWRQWVAPGKATPEFRFPQSAINGGTKVLADELVCRLLNRIGKDLQFRGLKVLAALPAFLNFPAPRPSIQSNQ